MTSILFQLAIAGALSASLVEAEPTFSVLGLSDPGDRIHELLAQPGSPSDLEVETPAVEVAGIEVDGRLDDEAWEHAALLDGFTQFSPIEGSEATQDTKILVLVDAEAIYFAVKAFDESPASIRATLTDRDSYTYTDDYVRFILDTFDDQRRAYVFTVNPYGVQHDGLWNEIGGSTGRRGRGMFSPIDDNPDFLWESDAEITQWG